MKFGLLLLATVLQVASANENTEDRYRLPPSKVYIEPCQHKALLLHPGRIENQKFLHWQQTFWVRHQIQADDGSEWLVLCDLGNGKIVRQQRLIDGTLGEFN
jgi:hypothetical protein